MSNNMVKIVKLERYMEWN